MRALLLIPLFALALSASYRAQTAAGDPFSLRLLQDELWTDGKAEISVYRATERKYGILRERAEVRHILVREPFAPAALVKTENPNLAGAYPVMKLNQVIRIPTGSYRYDQMHSSFWRVSDGTLIKFSLASIDSCGNTYKEGRRQGERWGYRAHTYWEGMDAVTEQLSGPRNLLYYDELPWRLRLIDWDRVSSFQAPLVPSTIHSKADKLSWSTAAFEVDATAEGGHQVVVRHDQGEDRFIFGNDYPHPLLSWSKWDGSELRLIQRVRLPYWELNRPGDERYLAPGAEYP